MHPGKVVLALSALVSLVAGSLSQSPKHRSLPVELFAHAAAQDFVGEARCAECHESTANAFPRSPHAIYVHNGSLGADKKGCEACHGPGKAHVEEGSGKHILDYPKLASREVIDACLRCHGDLMKKPHFRAESHARVGLSCINCHQVHPREVVDPGRKDRGIVRGQIFAAKKDSNPMLRNDEAVLCGECHQPELAAFRKSSHHPVPEGRMNCSDCHSIHPTNADRVKARSYKDRCVTCHADLAGPFAFEHDPVAGWVGGGCTECHSPHGGSNPKLLTASSRGLCAQCHTDKGGANHHPGQSCWSAGCHVAVHGSNHDPRLLSK